MLKTLVLAATLLSSAAAVAATDSDLGAGRHAAATITHPAALRKPTAYGAVFQDGTVESGSGNFTARWNSTANWYEIAITGVNYYYLSHATTITASTPSGNGFCQSDSVSGLLLVRCYTLAGQPTQATFGFTTF